MAFPEGCFSHLEVLDDEYWALKGCSPDVAVGGIAARLPHYTRIRR